MLYALLSLIMEPAFNGRVFLSELKDNGVPSKLFKFMRFNPSIDCGGISDLDKIRPIVSQNKIWLSSRRDFSDENDLSPRIVANPNPNDDLTDFSNRLSERYGLSRSHAYERCKKIASNENELEHYKKHVNNGLDLIGIYCLTKNSYKSNFMWEQYSGAHEGICIEFDMRFCRDFFERVRRVRYSSRELKVNFFDEVNPDDADNNFYCKKPSFELENEYRLIYPEMARQSVLVERNGISKIYMGRNLGKEAEKLLRELLEARRKNGLPPLHLKRM